MSIVHRIRQLPRKIASKILYNLPRKTARSIRFKKQHGYKMDFRNPQTLDEKLNWLLTYYIGDEHAIYADKVGVRTYVVKKGFEELLPGIYGVWDHANDIPLEELPKKFVLKCNHASGEDYYEIVHDKAAVNWPSVLERLERMLQINYVISRCEYQYNTIKPCIYAEELLEDGRGSRMTDYKIFCFWGKPHCIMACAGRGENLRRAFYDVDWKYLNYSKKAAPGDDSMEKPEGLDVMLEAAAVLAKDFPFARMDFYDVGGKVYFGEITLTPDNCNIQHLSYEAQKKLGDLLDLKPLMK